MVDANDSVFDRVDEYDRLVMMRQQEVQTSSKSVVRRSRRSLLSSSASAHTPRSYQEESEKDLLTMLNEIFHTVE